MLQSPLGSWRPLSKTSPGKQNTFVNLNRQKTFIWEIYGKQDCTQERHSMDRSLKGYSCSRSVMVIRYHMKGGTYNIIGDCTPLGCVLRLRSMFKIQNQATRIQHGNICIIMILVLLSGKMKNGLCIYQVNFIMLPHPLPPGDTKIFINNRLIPRLLVLMLIVSPGHQQPWF